jgi:hypothetical protein
VGEADVAAVHGLHGLDQVVGPLAYRDPVSRGIRGHVTVVADPVDPAVGALVVPVHLLVEFSRHPGKLEVQLVDGVTEKHEELCLVMRQQDRIHGKI